MEQVLIKTECVETLAGCLLLLFTSQQTEYLNHCKTVRHFELMNYPFNDTAGGVEHI